MRSPAHIAVPETGQPLNSNHEGEHDMSKTKEELNAIKEEVEAVNEKLAELTEEEIAQVTGGVQLADMVKTAIVTATSDPAVVTP